MDAAALQSLISARGGDLPLEAADGAPPHPQVPGHEAVLSPAGEPGAPAVLHAGAVTEEEASRVLALVEERLAEDEAAAEVMPRDKSIFEAHAGFIADQAVPRGWYRRGEPLAPGLWVVDLDVFLEVLLPASAWEALRGTTVSLRVEGEPLDLELPADVDFDECWTLPGAGLFEPEAGVQLEDLDPDDDVPGRFGDLHVVPVVL